MNIEDLSKTQLLWLTILVNFVTSIATGVMTVSLLDQAPPVVTQTVHEIVDHTIETVTTPIQPVTDQKPTPTQPTGEDLLTGAISADVARSVSIYGASTSTPAIAVGVYLPKSRAVATAAAENLPKEALIVFRDGSTASASLSRSGATMAIYGFADAAKLPSAPSPKLLTKVDLKQGQTVIGLASDQSAATGIISKIDETALLTTLAGIPAGAGIVNLDGNLVGIMSGTPGSIISSDRINTLLSATSSTPTP